MSTQAIEVIHVKQPPMFHDLDSLVTLLHQESMKHVTAASPHSPILLRDVKHLFKHLWLPMYLPPDFDVDKAEVTNPQNPHPDLAFPCLTNEGTVMLTVDIIEEHNQEYVTIEKADVIAEIKLGQREGYLIRGAWMVTTDVEGRLVGTGWDEEELLKILVHDKVNNQLITLMSSPASLLPESELLKIAESLESVRNHRVWFPWIRSR
ncbi:hypothetical protein GC175_19210 [bacterium]|nr:hypothetical protein [bacterium]